MTKTCCLSEGARQTMLEEIYARYQGQVGDPNCVDVVPTPYASLALATADATASPVTIIAEVVNAGDPSENGVYAIEPNGDTKKLDGAILANNGLNKDGNTIVLGQDVGEAGDPAKLLSNREIPMDGKNLELEASNGDRTVFDGSNGNQSIGGNNVSYNTGDGTKTNERYNTADNIYYEIMNAKSADNYGVRYVKFVQSKNGVINTGDDAVVEYLYPQDSFGNNAVIHVSRGDGYVRNLDGTINRNVNLIGHSDNGIYVLGDSGSWLSRTDYINGSGNVPPILSTATTEPMAIDTATGQLGIAQPLTTYSYDYDSGFLAVATNTPPTYNTAQHNHWSNTYTPPSFIVPTAPTGYTYYIVGHLYTIIANQTYYNCSLSHYIDLFVNGVQQSRGSITQLPNEEIFYDGDVNSMMQDVSAGVNTLRIDIDSRKVIGWSVTSLGGYTDHALLMRIKAKILLRKI